MSTERLLSLVIRWLLLALAVWVAAEVVSGIHLEGTADTFAVALILGLLNLYLRPLLVVLSLPVTLITFGLFIIVINALLLLLTDWIAGWFDLAFSVDGLGAALLGALIISIVNLVTGTFIRADSIARRLSGGF
jgi:putative membrane protein